MTHPNLLEAQDLICKELDGTELHSLVKAKFRKRIRTAQSVIEVGLIAEELQSVRKIFNS